MKPFLYTTIGVYLEIYTMYKISEHSPNTNICISKRRGLSSKSKKKTKETTTMNNTVDPKGIKIVRKGILIWVTQPNFELEQKVCSMLKQG